jgi:hypothetical protein
VQDCRVKTLCTAVAAVFTTGAVFATAALADSSSFSETQSPDDQLFHIDVGASYLNVGQPPRDQNLGVGTIKISLPGSQMRFDPALPIDQSGYTCSVTSSTYGEPNTGYICTSNGQVQGAGLVFPNAVTVHLLSQNCYAPPPEGSAQPGVAEVWASPGDPGTPPDASFPLYGDPGCDSGSAEPPVDNFTPAMCIVPKLKNLPLRKAKQKLTRGGCKTGKVNYVFSATKKGSVVKQSAKAGKKVKLGTKVKLTVSKGKKPGSR